MYGISGLINSVVSLNNRYYTSGNTKKLFEILSKMPKPNSARIAVAQRQRQVITKKAEKYGPSTVYLQVLGSGAKGVPNTLYMFTDQKRYMFNCGECTQRLAHEHKVKLSKLDHIFITRKTWKNIGGLPGLSLTLQDVGVPNITLHGPDGLDELYNATKRFVIMKDMSVTMAKTISNNDFEDNVMTVKYVLLGPLNVLLGSKSSKQPQKKPKTDFGIEKEFEEFINDETDYYNCNKSIVHKEKPKLWKQISLDKTGDLLKNKTDKILQNLQNFKDCSVAYICTLKKRLGTLDLTKCVEMGVKPGPMLGQLKNGIDVVLANGNVVRSKDVKTPDDPGPVFIVLEVPDTSYLQETEFQSHFDDGLNPRENIPVLIVHFTPPHVLQHPKYTSFIEKFGPSTQHLILNSNNSCLGSEAVHRSQHKLHLLDPDIFPLLRDVSIPAVWNLQAPTPKTDSPVKMKCLEDLKNKIAIAQFQSIITLEGSGKGETHLLQETGVTQPKVELLAGRTLTMFHLRPKKEIDRSAEPKLHVQEYIQETMDMDGFAGSLAHFRQLVDSSKNTNSETLDYPKIVFLGTGSCIPSKTRNTSAIVVQIDENHSMLMDCGEGTFGQLVRFYGPKKVNAFLRTLKAVYISHLHADHHIGLIGVLQARRAAYEEVPKETYVPLYLLAPGQIVTWLTVYDQQFETIKENYTLIPNQSLLHDAPSSSPDMTSAVLAAMGVARVVTCRVAHCPNAFGVAVEIRGQKITYSGDTLPCQDLVHIGENSSLLIHEATMEDELSDEARTKMHSTTTQAIDIGRQMSARFTVLTHFSQRYARLPRLNANILNNNQSVGIAFDNMQITMNDLELLPHMYAPLQLMFAEHCVEMEMKANHRQLREKRDSFSLTTPKRSRHNIEPTISTEEPRCRTLMPKRPSRSRITPSVNKKSHIPMIKVKTPTEVTNKQPAAHARSRSLSQSSTISPNVTGSPMRIRQNTPEKSAGGAMGRSIVSPSVQSAPHNTQQKQSTCPRSYSSNQSNLAPMSKLESGKQNISPVRQPCTPQSRSRSYSMSPSFRQNDQQSRDVSGVDRRLLKQKLAATKPTTAGNDVKSDIIKQIEMFGSDCPHDDDASSQDTSPTETEDISVTIDKFLATVEDLQPTPSELCTNPFSAEADVLKINSQKRESTLNTLLESKIPVWKYKYCRKCLPSSIKTSPDTLQDPNKKYQLLETYAKFSNKINKSRSSIDSVKNQIFENSFEAYEDIKTKTGTKTHPQPTKTTIMRSCLRNYKPQLEDIKSSYLILNQHGNPGQLRPCAPIIGKNFQNKLDEDYLSEVSDLEETKSICTHTYKLGETSIVDLPKVSKPTPFNEAVRQKQLLEAKKKFSSREFCIESKYDKIEGLNWISWK